MAEQPQRLEQDQLLMVKAAWYYYIEDYTQQRISSLLNISRAKVISLLERARQTGVIQFSLQQDSEHRMNLERNLLRRFQLKDTFVVPSSRTLVNPRESVAQAAAMYLQRRLEPGGYLNIGYGETTRRILNHLAAAVEAPINVVSLTGGVNYYLPNTCSSAFNARLFLAPSPLLLSSVEARDSLRRESDVEEVFRMVPFSHFSVVSVGSVDEDATIVKNGILSAKDISHLRRQGAVGDVLSHFIDADGGPVSPELEQRLMSTPLEQLRSLNNVIGVAAEREKVEAVRGVLRGGYLDVLIVDEDLAEALLHA